MWEDAALSCNQPGDDFIKEFLLSEPRLASHPNNRFALRRPERPDQPGELPMRPGYRFVEYVEPAVAFATATPLPRIENPTVNGVEGDVTRERSNGPAPRYAFTYEPLVNSEDRAFWVAGVKLKAIDQQSGEVLGELTRYVFDPGFGVSTTGRWPWQHANTANSTMCPSNSAEPTGLTHRHFIDTVLFPNREVDHGPTHTTSQVGRVIDPRMNSTDLCIRQMAGYAEGATRPYRLGTAIAGPAALGARRHCRNPFKRPSP